MEQPLRIPGEDFTVILKKGGQTPSTAVVITKKVARLAVDRNRIKRLFREALRSLDFKREIKIIVKKNIAQYKMIQVKTALERLINKNVKKNS